MFSSPAPSGTGKSALLDLMQYVLLGEHWRANRAAAGNARGRDLIGYGLGDTDQTRDGQRHFLRSSGVTLAALEFARAERGGREAQRETWGIRVRVLSPGPDAAPKRPLPSGPAGIRGHRPGGHPPSEQHLPRLAAAGVRRRVPFRPPAGLPGGNGGTPPPELRHRRLPADVPKAIAFRAEENVGKFIREFILEESPLDVSEVRSSLRAYDDTRKRWKSRKDEAVFLQRVGGTTPCTRLAARRPCSAIRDTSSSCSRPRSAVTVAPGSSAGWRTNMPTTSRP